MIKKLGVKKFIETGTCRGETTMFLAENLPEMKITTIEIDKTSFDQVQQPFLIYKNITSLLGDSAEIIVNMIDINELTIYYLDAHWLAVDPLTKEVETLTKSRNENAIIIVDDFHVPYYDDIVENTNYHTYEKISKYFGSNWKYMYNYNAAQIIFYDISMEDKIKEFIDESKTIDGIKFSIKI